MNDTSGGGLCGPEFEEVSYCSMCSLKDCQILQLQQEIERLKSGCPIHTQLSNEKRVRALEAEVCLERARRKSAEAVAGAAVSMLPVDDPLRSTWRTHTTVFYIGKEPNHAT